MKSQRKSLQRRLRRKKSHKQNLPRPLPPPRPYPTAALFNLLARQMNSYVTAMQTFTTQMAKVNLVTSFWPEDHRTWQVPDPEGAPDVMGYVRGYRAFRYEQHTHMASYSPMDWSTQPPTKRVPLETRMSLRSLNHEYEWLNRRGHAVCGSARPHKAPDPNCSCGFYAVFDPRRVPGIGRYDYGYDSAGYVLASVKAWGNIIEASDGFRAEYMPLERGIR